jgi:Ca2+-binding RTX toxin-like protein
MITGKRQGFVHGNRPNRRAIANALQLEALESRWMLNVDITPPVAVLDAPPVTSGGASAYVFTIRYIDDVAMDDGTVDGDEVRITGPSNYNPIVTLKSKQTLGDGSILATYEFIPPGGRWTSADNSLAGYAVDILINSVKDIAGNSVLAGQLGTIIVDIETVAPTASIKTSPLPSPTAGQTTYSFVVIYADNVGMDISTFGGDISDLTISKTGFTVDATYLSHIPGAAANSYEVTYEFTAPGGTWGAEDNGAYTITRKANAVLDVNGNAIPSGSLATLSVNIPDTDGPTAALVPAVFNATGNGTFQFTVSYNDNVGLNTATFGTGDILVTRPGGYTQLAAYVRFEVGAANERRVIYELPPPGGTWDSADNGVYTVYLLENEVRDNFGNAAAGAILGTFNVAIAPVDNSIPAMTLADHFFQPLGQSLVVTVLYTDPQGMNDAYLSSSKIIVQGPGGRIMQLHHYASDASQNPQARFVTYVGPAPGGVWDPSDNGLYTVIPDANFRAVDTGNNPVDPGVVAGTFEINVALNPVALDFFGNLVVYGTDDADVITLNIINNMLRVSLNGQPQDFVTGQVTSITIHGLGGDDFIAIGPGIMGALIYGGPGNDTISGGDGNDSIYGEDGDDSLMGGGGNDYLSGGNGNDYLNGGAGNDTLDGGLGDDVMYGGPGIDTVDYSWRISPLRIYINGAPSSGQAGEFDSIMLDVENVVGGFGDDFIVGSAGANFLWGGPGNDTLMGGAGDDTLDGGPGADVMFGGPGNDTVTYASRRNAVFASIDNRANDGELGERDNIMNDVENLIGGWGNDVLVGSKFNNKIWGGPGNDTIKGGGGDDTLVGGPGRDQLFGGPGNDRFYAADGQRDLIVGGPGRNIAEVDADDEVREVQKIIRSKRPLLK